VGVTAQLPTREEIRERVLLLKRFLGQLEWEWPNDVKTKVSEYLGLTENHRISLERLAECLTDAQLERLIPISPVKDYYTFRGNYYTVERGGIFKLRGSWDEVREAVRQILKDHGGKGYALLKALVEVERAPFESIAAKASEAFGERLYPARLIAELRNKWGLAWKVGSRQYPAWAMPEEVKPAVTEVLAEFEATPPPTLRTKYAQQEFLEVIKMEEEFKNHLSTLVKERLEQTVKFGRAWSPNALINYLHELYGQVIFFDHLLSITQQYSICDTDVVAGEEGVKALNTGFNLALFGEPGTGKTFATKDMILGSEAQNVPPHGLPGLNRYCGGMTPARFIAVGEAYQSRRFNFVVTEFNDWFKYRGMVEPLKLAMERGEIRYETKTYTVGPYKFTSFFSVNYNTQVKEKGYEVTVSDPNFNAIEDRMLCRLHRLTKEKYSELSKSQRRLMMGVPQRKMIGVAPKLRDHLTLVYAIETKHPLIAEAFHDKKVLLTDEMFNLLEKASRLILEHLETKTVPFSMRLERRAIQLASAMSLTNFFNTDSDLIPVDPTAAKMAVRFFVEEAWVRANEAFPLYQVLQNLF